MSVAAGDGALLRVWPSLMKVSVIIAGLLPIMLCVGGEVGLAAAAPEHGNFMGRGPAPFQGPEDGRFEAEIGLLNDGVYPDGSATARLEMLGPSAPGVPMIGFTNENVNQPAFSLPQAPRDKLNVG